MKVTLIGKTELNYDLVFPDDNRRWWFESGPMELDDDIDSDAQQLIEFAGRSCYQSFHKPNPATRKNADYIANIIAQGHHSVLEHASATFYIEGVSRALTHELIRHRHLSFSELSQRFVNVEDAEVVYPPAVRGDAVLETNMDYAFRAARQAYDGNNNILTTAGFPRKQAREAARAVMPNATETRIVVTGNHRAWRDMLGKRYSTHADAEICELATELLRQLREIAPAVYADFPEVPFS